jgi:hypothetical protein
MISRLQNIHFGAHFHFPTGLLRIAPSGCDSPYGTVFSVGFFLNMLNILSYFGHQRLGFMETRKGHSWHCVHSREVLLWKRNLRLSIPRQYISVGTTDRILIELLVSIATIGILAASVLSGVFLTKSKSLTGVYLNNLRQIGIGATVYARDDRDCVIYAKRNKPGNRDDDGSFVHICLGKRS